MLNHPALRITEGRATFDRGEILLTLTYSTGSSETVMHQSFTVTPSAALALFSQLESSLHAKQLIEQGNRPDAHAAVEDTPLNPS